MGRVYHRGGCIKVRLKYRVEVKCSVELPHRCGPCIKNCRSVGLVFCIKNCKFSLK